MYILLVFAEFSCWSWLFCCIDAFRGSSWTASLVAKITEVYYISKREAAHTQMLKIRHTTQRGGSMLNLKEEDPGASPQLVCSDCNAP